MPQTLQDLSALSEVKLIELVKRTANRVMNATIETGKAIFALDRIRDGKGTLKKYVRQKTGIDVPDHAFSVAVALRLVGPGFSFIEETLFDKVPLRWLLQVSAIVNLLDKDEKWSKEEKAQFREDVCKIMRELPKDGYSQLMDIKDILKPEGQDAGDGDGKDGEQEKVLPFPSDLLDKEHLKAIGTAAFNCPDAEKLDQAVAILRMVLEVAENKANELRQTPAAMAA